MSALNDENGKRSSTRTAGLLLLALLVPLIVADVWFAKEVESVVYETLEMLIISLVVGVSARSAMKTAMGREPRWRRDYEED